MITINIDIDENNLKNMTEQELILCKTECDKAIQEVREVKKRIRGYELKTLAEDKAKRILEKLSPAEKEAIRLVQTETADPKNGK